MFHRDDRVTTWRPIVGDESLICEPEETYEYDRNGVSIIFHDCISGKVPD